MYNFRGFTQKANLAVNFGIEIAQSLSHTWVGSEHILLGLLKEGSGVAAEALSSENVDFRKVYELAKEKIGSGNSPVRLTINDFTPRAKHVIEMSNVVRAKLGNSYIGTEHLLIALLEDEDSYAVAFLEELGVETEILSKKIIGDIASENRSDGVFAHPNIFGGPSGNKKNGGTKTLEQFGRDLTRLAKEGKIDPVIGREKEIERVIQILSRRTKNNPCLIGEPGVGKTAVAEGLALKISNGEVPEILRDKRIFSLDLTGMIAGTKYRGDFEERIKNAIDEVKNSSDIILFIDELHTIIGAGSAEGSADAANILKPSLAR